GSLIDGRKKPVAPERRTYRGRKVRTQYDESRKALVVCTQAIGHPRSHRRTARLIGAGVHHEASGFVVRDIGVDRANPADVISKLAKVGPQFAEIHPALTVLLEFER